MSLHRCWPISLPAAVKHFKFSLSLALCGFFFFLVKVEMSCGGAGLRNPLLDPLHSLFTPDSFKLKL